MTNESNRGAARTREYYDSRGWVRQQDGKLVDIDLFGVKEDGPLRSAGHKVRIGRIREAIKAGDDAVRLLECGTGGNPATELADLCNHFMGVDFSSRGLDEARKALAATAVPFDTQLADICELPFASDSFDAIYSAHVLYHVPSAAAQAAAIAEMIRVVRPGGVIVLVLANPRPLSSPLRLLMRLIADTPGVSTVADRLRPPAPIPYNPMSISWTRRQFRGRAAVDVVTYAIPSTWFKQHISERSVFGSRLWKMVNHLELRMPHLSAHLGNYVTVIARKNG